jgi:predicted small metal-binding protein
MNCDFVARGETRDEILRQAGEHARTAHRMQITPDLRSKVEGLIHDESSEEHHRSMAGTRR